MTAVKTVTSNRPHNVLGPTFATVPGMQTTVGVPAGEDALLVITFSAVSLCTDTACQIRVLVDGVEASPGTAFFDFEGDDENAETHSMQFVHRVNASGPHTVTVEWAATNPGGSFFMYDRTLTVLRSRIG